MQQREGREEEQRMAMDEQQQPSQSGVDQAQTKAAIGLTASRFQAAPRRNPSPAFAFFPSFSLSLLSLSPPLSFVRPLGLLILLVLSLSFPPAVTLTCLLSSWAPKPPPTLSGPLSPVRFS